MDDSHLAKRQRTAAPPAVGDITQVLGTDLLQHIVNTTDSPAHIVKWSEVCRLFYQIAHSANALGVRVLKGVADGSADLTGDPRVTRVLRPEDVAAWPYLPFLITGVRNRLSGGACRVPTSGIYGCQAQCGCTGCVDARRPNLLFSEWISAKKEPPANTTVFNGTDSLFGFTHLPRLVNAAASIRKVQFSRTAGTIDKNQHFVQLLRAPAAVLSSVEFVWCNDIEAMPSEQVCPNVNVRKLSIQRCGRFTDPGALAPKHRQNPADRREAQIVGCNAFTDVSPFVHATHLVISRCHNVSDISALAAAKHLVFLDISTSRLISSIPMMPALVELNAPRTGISTTANMAKIQKIVLSHTNVESLDGLTAAQTIDAVNTPIRSLAGMDSPKLVSINVSQTKVEDLAQVRNAEIVVAAGCNYLKSIESLGGGTVKHINIVGTCVTTFPERNCFETVVANSCCMLQSVEHLRSAVEVSMTGAGIRDWDSFEALKNATTVDVSHTAITNEGIRHLAAVRVLTADACIRVTDWSWLLAGDYLSVARNYKLNDADIACMKHRSTLILDRCCSAKTGIRSIKGITGGSVAKLSIVGLRHLREVAPASGCTEVIANRCPNICDGHYLKSVKVLSGAPYILAAATVPALRFLGATLWVNAARAVAELMVTVENVGRAAGAPPLTAIVCGGESTTEWGQVQIRPFSTGTAAYHFESSVVASWSTDMTEIDVEIGHGPGRAVAHIKSVQVEHASLGHNGAKRQRLE